jgi:hypothetical protein
MDVVDNFFDPIRLPMKKIISTGEESIAIAYVPVISSSLQQKQHPKNLLECTVTPTTLVPIRNESSTPFMDTKQYKLIIIMAGA